MKYACYCMTRNMYFKTIPAIRSLLINSDVDKVFLIIEDDTIDLELWYETPFSQAPYIEYINVSGQTFFPRGSPNFNSRWTYMVMMRTALPFLLPGVDKILSLDCDTIVDGDISDLWDIDITNDYYAAVREPSTSQRKGFTSCNMGVAMFNLEKLRDGMAEKVIRELNTTHHQFKEQDVLNDFCHPYIKELDSRYNACRFTSTTDTPLIHHFAAERNWHNKPLVKKYLFEVIPPERLRSF